VQQTIDTIGASVQRKEEASMLDSLSRRKFLQTSAIAAGGLLSPSSQAIMLEPQAQSIPAKPAGLA
jgi:hypothetical protein